MADPGNDEQKVRLDSMKYTTSLFYLLMLGMVCTLHTGCSYLARLFGKKPAAAETSRKELPPLYLGTVHQVYPAQNFALLRIIGPVPQPGVTLITHPADGSTSRMGNLVVSENNTGKGGIIAADVRSGSVVSGDRVFQYRSIAQPEPNQTGELIINDRGTEEQSATQTTSATTPAQGAQVANSQQVPAAPAPLPVQAADAAQAQPADAASNKPASQPAPFHVPQSPENIPSYLNDIPNDINQWD